MKYNILSEDTNIWLIDRLLNIRNINDNKDLFLYPNFANTWIDPYKLNDFQKWLDRIQQAISQNEKIMIFGDYDVDWITSSTIIFWFFKKFLNYKNISIKLPSRIDDWYWIKDYHMDEMKDIGVDLVITVDNGITAIKEVEYANKIWIDLVITDHHKSLGEIPKAVAVINPQISPNYEFKWIAGVWIAFKLVSALINIYIKDNSQKQSINKYLMPLVAIWTVADCVPLVSENRLFVKLWLKYLNDLKWIPKSLNNIIKSLNLKSDIDSFHIWYMIAPRLNAWWRMTTPYDSLNTLIFSDKRQSEAIKKLEKLNTDRRSTQESIFQEVIRNIDTKKKILISKWDYHEWIVWIVSWKLTEKYNKPSAIIKIDQKTWLAVGSLRWPSYFNIVDMLNFCSELLERFWWHKQAWWMTVKIENLDEVISKFEEYCEENISDNDLEKTISVDTFLTEKDWKKNVLSKLDLLAPFGEWNPEPKFIIKDLIIKKATTVWNNGKSHLKIIWNLWKKEISVLLRSKWKELDKVKWLEKIDIIWKVKKDTFNWWYYFNGDEIYFNMNYL